MSREHRPALATHRTGHPGTAGRSTARETRPFAHRPAQATGGVTTFQPRLDATVPARVSSRPRLPYWIEAEPRPLQVTQRKAKNSRPPSFDWRTLEPRPLAATVGRVLAGAGAVQRSPTEASDVGKGTSRGRPRATPVDVSPGSGTPLPPAIRAQMEGAFRTDFSEVRLHQGQAAPALGARALTQGRDIHLGPGEFDPGSRSSRELLGHELAHVVQQREGRVAAPAQAKGVAVNEDPGLEAEADVAGQRAADGRAVVEQGDRSPGAGQQPPTVVQAKKMSASSVLKALRKIPFVKKKLDTHLVLRRGSEEKEVDTSVLEHVRTVLKQYEQHFKKENDGTANHAMLLAAVLEAVAKVIAFNELNDPELAPRLAVELLEAYRAEILDSLGKMDEKEDVVDLTVALVMHDPVAQYMHKEIPVAVAARQVRLMANLAGKEAEEMFVLLRQKFEAQMATLELQTVKKQEDKSTVFSVKNAPGEVTSHYFEQLFGSDVPKPGWNRSRGEDDKEHHHLAFTEGASARLDKLATKVAERNVVEQPNLSDTEGLTYKQSQHLGKIEQKDERTKQDTGFVTREQAVARGLAKFMKLDEGQGEVVLQQVKAGLADLPITITVQAMAWFGDKVPDKEQGETTYKAGSSRRNEKQLSDLLEKEDLEGSIKHLGTWEKPEHLNQERGGNYYRFRHWKDQVMTSKLGFSDEELPAFGAVNLNWDAHSTMNSKKPEEYGVNSYGDTHFVLDKQAIEGRVVYTATDHGEPHADPYLTFLDFVSGGKSRTGLKDVTNMNLAVQVVNSVLTRKPVDVSVQAFEVQIFGELDVARDVSKIVVAPSVDQAAKNNIEAFCAKYSHITYELLEQPQEAVLSRSWFYGGTDSQGKTFSQQVKEALNQL